MIKQTKRVLASFISIIIIAVLTIPCGAVNGAPDSTSPRKVMVCGVPFGIRLQTDGVAVVNLGEVYDGNSSYKPAADAGLHRGDIIESVNGTRIASAGGFRNIINETKDENITLTYERLGKLRSARVRVRRDSEGNNRIGVWIRDGAAGIGTMTFIDPETNGFGGLGHGISISENGEPMPISEGYAEGADITGISPGKPGAPGELRGNINGKPLGVIGKNTKTGVYGYLGTLPEAYKGEMFEIAPSDAVVPGQAYLLGSPDGNGVKLYSIEITDMATSSPTKNFSVKINDDELIALTGGIVQGMSGTPIIQNGKLIGALTHVMINDPQRGYGIFIENMLTELSSLKPAL